MKKRSFNEKMRNLLDAVFTFTASPEEKSRSGLRDDGETNSKTVQRIPGELLADPFKPKITFTHKTMTFNTSCVNLFPDTQYVTISIDVEKRRFFIEPATYHDRDHLKFANVKNGKNIPRTCVTNYFCSALYELMKWNPETKYRIFAIYQVFDDKKIMVFNLDEALEVFSGIFPLGDTKNECNIPAAMPLN